MNGCVKLLFLYAVVVHVFAPIALAVEVNCITTVPSGSISLIDAPERLNRINPAGGDPSTLQLRETGPGSVAVTVTPVGVPAPEGMAIAIDPITIETFEVVFVTVIVYETGDPLRAVVGEMIADAEPVFCTLIVRVALELFPATSKAFAVHKWSPSVRPLVL